jgi:WD40 repeat protein
MTVVRALDGPAVEIRSVAWSPDSTRLATAGSDAGVRLWDFSGGRTVVHRRGVQQGLVDDVAWSPEGDLLAMAGEDGQIGIWAVWRPAWSAVPVDQPLLDPGP